MFPCNSRDVLIQFKINYLQAIYQDTFGSLGSGINQPHNQVLFPFPTPAHALGEYWEWALPPDEHLKRMKLGYCVEMGMSCQFSSLYRFVYRPNRCWALPSPTSSGRGPLRGSTPDSRRASSACCLWVKWQLNTTQAKTSEHSSYCDIKAQEVVISQQIYPFAVALLVMLQCFRAIVCNFGFPDVLSLHLPEILAHTASSEGFWEF